MFLVVSSVTKAQTQDGADKDLVSVLHIEAGSILGLKDSSGIFRMAPIRNSRLESKYFLSRSLPSL